MKPVGARKAHMHISRSQGQRLIWEIVQSCTEPNTGGRLYASSWRGGDGKGMAGYAMSK